MIDQHLDANDDWIETLRLTLYPKLHPYLEPFGGYAVGSVGSGQYVGTLDEGEETIEDALDDRGRRNPIACLKSLDDGRVSEGSWVLLHGDCPGLIEAGMQVHITLFKRADGEPGRELYAHYEDDWRVAPIPHLRATNFDASVGVDLATEYLDEHTHLLLQ